ncbi:hypothetical protein BJ508DRAFT_409861 [Ascobolus immersus RN42]|uniref:Uncharacterized protein n=1 Tax=Ascobolus immersus RN42 TaxID=1160509 RepID=A0A3N4J1Y2_ASCIM|nr:hypothetical protein BJ508DRAFT_409861 [Ascobolus immersus RN42]
MVEPLSIIGLISNIAQFSEYAINLIAEVRNVCQEGQSISHSTAAALSDATKDLGYYMSKVRTSTQEGMFNRATNDEDFEIEQNLFQRYTKISEELAAVLQEIRVDKDNNDKPTVLQSVQTVWKGYRNKDRIKDLGDRLKRLRKDAEIRNSFLLRIHRDDFRRQFEAIMKASYSNSKEIGEMRLEMVSRMEGLSKAIADMLKLIDPGSSIARECNPGHLSGSINGLWDEQRLPEGDKRSWDSEEEVSEGGARVTGSRAAIARKFSVIEAQLSWQVDLLKSLYDSALNQRQETVRDNHGDTLKWVYSSDSNGKEAVIPAWLGGASGILWISGKAGSGKSTLMKYLCRSQKTRAVLGRWARDLPLVVASHYFWMSGVSIQRSICGFYRSLLFQIFSQRPELLSDIQICRTRPPTSEWTFQELRDVVKDVVRASAVNDKSRDRSSGGFRMCIFIDGLDEYDDEEGQQDDIISVVRNLAEFENTKVCVSSRSGALFQKAFGKRSRKIPKISLHELTLPDMKAYVSSELASLSSSGLQCTTAQFESTISAVAMRANGVWLWLYLVVQILKRELQSKAIRILDVTKRAQQIPTDIEKYICWNLDRTGTKFRQEAAMIFLLVLEADGMLPGVALKFLLQNVNQHRQVRFAAQRVPIVLAIRSEKELETLRSKLNNRCGDLLEMDSQYIDVTGKESDDIDSHNTRLSANRVFFRHRCIRDFLRFKYYDKLCQQAQPPEQRNFDPRITWAAVNLIFLRSLRSDILLQSDMLVDYLHTFFRLSAGIDAEILSIIKKSKVTRLSETTRLPADSGWAAAVSFENLLCDLPDGLQRQIRTFHALVNGVRDSFDHISFIECSAIHPSIGIIGEYARKRSQAVLFTSVAITAGLNTYVKAMLSETSSLELLKDSIPDLLRFAIQPLDLKMYLDCLYRPARVGDFGPMWRWEYCQLIEDTLSPAHSEQNYDWKIKSLYESSVANRARDLDRFALGAKCLDIELVDSLLLRCKDLRDGNIATLEGLNYLWTFFLECLISKKLGAIGSLHDGQKERLLADIALHYKFAEAFLKHGVKINPTLKIIDPVKENTRDIGIPKDTKDHAPFEVFFRNPLEFLWGKQAGEILHIHSRLHAVVQRSKLTMQDSSATNDTGDANSAAQEPDYSCRQEGARDAISGDTFSELEENRTSDRTIFRWFRQVGGGLYTWATMEEEYSYFSD